MTIEYEFDEVAYKTDNPDVKKAIKWSRLPDGNTHFKHFGYSEGRVPNRDKVQFQFSIDFSLISKDGYVIVQGWLDDHRKIVSHVTFKVGYLKIKVPKHLLLRYFRPDVSEFLGDQNMRLGHGFLFFAALPSVVPLVDSIVMTVSNPYISNENEFPLKTANTHQLIDSTLEVIHHASHGYSNLLIIEEFMHLFESQLDRAWRQAITEQTNYSVSEVCCDESHAIELSVISVLFKRHNLLAAQSVLLFKELQSKGAEIIICNNSPEIFDSLYQQMQILNKAYGIYFKIINFTRNVGFSRANNIGAEIAQSDKLLFINPDVFPKSQTSVEHLLSAVKAVGKEEVIGGILNYGDESIMHGGMAILRDDFPNTAVLKNSDHLDHILRVDHYLKGAPSTLLSDISDPIPVQAVSGALMIVDKVYFQKLNGFSEEYLFGHYEDADLCMRVWKDGGKVLLDTNVRLYHFEGEGSGKTDSYLENAQHINRVKFTKKWLDSCEKITARSMSIQQLVTHQIETDKT